jgi:hypothetical protein
LQDKSAAGSGGALRGAAGADRARPGGAAAAGLDAAAAGAATDGAAAAAAAASAAINEVDSFGQKLDAILAADLTNDALSQGSLDTIPLGPLATLMPLLQMAGQLNDPAIKRALKQVRCS